MTASSVLVLYNEPLLPLDHPDAESEHTIVYISNQLADILREDGFDVALFGLKDDPAVLWEELRRRRPDVVFNMFEGNLDNTETESYVAALLEWSGVPFTGSKFRTLSLGRAKHLTKQLLRGAGLPTADFFVVESLPVPPWQLSWPAIVKPATQDGSIGVDQTSVVTDQSHLDQRVAQVLETYGPPVLVEEYIQGREFNVALTELPDLKTMPPSEINFTSVPPDKWPILTYAGKWYPGTAEFDLTPPQYPAKISQRLAERLSDLAKQAYRLLGCRDYARVDFRVKANGRPYILEVNPNPEISANAGFAGSLGSADVPHRDFVVQLVRYAMNRCKGPEPTWAMKPAMSGPTG